MLPKEKLRRITPKTGAAFLALMVSTAEAGPAPSVSQEGPHITDALAQRISEVTKTLKSLGAKELFGDVTISRIPFHSAYPATSSQKGRNSNMPNLREPSMWNLGQEWEVRYWMTGKCRGQDLFVGFSIDDPSKNIKAFTEPWDDKISVEVLEGGAPALPSWVNKACK